MGKGIMVIQLILLLAGYVFGQNLSDFQIIENTGRVTIIGYTGTARDVRIPESINGRTVVAIGNRAFYGKQLISITIPNGVTSIGESAFYNNQLTSVTIPNSVISIGDYAFSFNQLTSVTIPDSVNFIGDRAFFHNLLTGVTIPNGVTSIGEGAFRDNRLTSVTIPDSVNFLGSAVFVANSNLSGINVSSGNMTYSSQDGVLFNKDKTTLVAWPARKAPVIIPLTVIIIEEQAFIGLRLTSITIPNSVITIGEFAFYGNLLTSVTIPASVTTIGMGAFGSNPLFPSVREELVKRFGEDIFYIIPAG